MKHYLLLIVCLAVILSWGSASAWVPLLVDDDPLVRMPGNQPQPDPTQQNIPSPSKENDEGMSSNCINCHKGDPTAPSGQGAPFFQWQGSMMAQAARDPIFWATMTVAGQDSIWAVGRPNATDICLRCHFPEGWMGERSSVGSDTAGASNALNGSAMTGSDFDGVHCGACHRMYNPFFKATNAGTREGGSNLAAYWDEATGLSQIEANETATWDAFWAGSLTYMNGQLLYANNEPKEAGYTENGGGQIFIDLVSPPWANMRGPFADPAMNHGSNPILYSRYHKSKFFCSTCHDVSNPVLANLGDDPADGLLSEQQSAHTYAHVERTFSEFMSSEYGRGIGTPTNQEFQNLGGPATATKCQDCHMPVVPGNVYADGSGEGVLRPGGSTEHPNSGVPAHDLQGGNMWMTRILASLDSSRDEYDAINYGLLNQGAGVLTLDLTQGHDVKADNFGKALLASSKRAEHQLLRAATIKNLTYNPLTGALSFRVQNNTGHKLLSGYPEGRRMFANVQAYSNANLVYEVNPYDPAAGTFKGGLDFWDYNGNLGGTVVPPPAALGANEEFNDDLVYEAVTRSALTGEDHTFHFALATDRYKDNRIPPKGFDLAEAQSRLSEPVASGSIKDTPATAATNLYSAAEYTGGYDDVSLTIPDAAAKNITHVTVTLYYQGTSREYIEFLRDEINATGSNRALFGPDNIIAAQNQTYATANGLNPDTDNAYLAQTDPFFTALKAWGGTIWELWAHNHGLDGSTASVEGIVPFAMASASVPAQGGLAFYTIHLKEEGTGYIQDITSGEILCDKTSAGAKTCDLLYAIGSTINYRAVPHAGSTFGGFSGDAQINGDVLTDTINGNETIEAIFNLTTPGVAYYTLQLTGDGKGYIEDTATGTILCDKISVGVQSCSLPNSIGSAISYRAVPRAGSRFDGFIGNAQFNGNMFTDTITGNEIMKAAFNLNSGMNITLMTAILIAAEKGSEK
ncbi:MAG TPA: hypothetical protein DDY20_07275 [Desulfobulbaceae bacterium]|nr:hypothetical protein [Desulfobulbaceae bacterium]